MSKISISNSIASARARLGVIALGMCLLVLVPAATAAAADPTDEQYSPSLEQLSTGGQGGDPGSAASAAGGLPFTGLDVALLAAVAAGLVLAGLVLRRQRPSESPRA